MPSRVKTARRIAASGGFGTASGGFGTSRRLPAPSRKAGARGRIRRTFPESWKNGRMHLGRTVLRAEAQAIMSLLGRVDATFDRAVHEILACRGRVVLTGMGKTGLVAQKISATLASTGTPSLFLHPAEAYHGDLGRVVAEDLVIVLSNSGETQELVRLAPQLKRIGARILAIVCDGRSTVARAADIALVLGEIEEACPLGLAPSASTTAMLALGDALAMCVLQARGFDKRRFALYHPAGEIGRKLLRVKDIWRVGEKSAVVPLGTTVREALQAVTRAGGGAASVVDRRGKLVGIFTDGDLRRKVVGDGELLERPIEDVMTRSPITVRADSLAAEATKLLRERKVDELPVLDEAGAPIGMLDVQDLLDADIF